MTTFVSSLGASDMMRYTIQRLQSDLTTSQTELASGKLADEGKSLGASTGSVFSYQSQQQQLQTLINSNGLAATKLNATQTALQSVTSDAQQFLAQVTAAKASGATAASLVQIAKNNLQGLMATLNISVNGEYIFGGINSAQQPMTSVGATPPSAAEQAINTSFTTAFGVAPGASGSSAISANAMQNYLDNQFSQGFASPQWNSNWSNASDTPMTARIALNETATTTVSANSSAFQQLTKAYAMISNLGVDQMGTATAQVVYNQAIQTVSQAIGGITNMEADLGSTQNRLSSVNDRMTNQMNLLKTSSDALTSVDPYQMTTHIQTLTTQLEAAYSLTGKLQNLSLTQYL